MAERLIDPTVYDRDPSLRSLIDLVPFGLPAEPPVPCPARRVPASGSRRRSGRTTRSCCGTAGSGTGSTRRPPSGRSRRWPSGGRRCGSCSWARRTRAPGAARPTRSGASPPSSACSTGTCSSTPSGSRTPQRGNWLLQADCAISTHVEHLETRFAFRTRLLDCFWARLPVVCTRGDDLGELVDREGAGVAVPQQDPAATADALEQRAEPRPRGATLEALDRLAEAFAWPRVAEPLVRFALAGPPAPRPRAALAPAASAARRARPQPTAPGATRSTRSASRTGPPCTDGRAPPAWAQRRRERDHVGVADPHRADLRPADAGRDRARRLRRVDARADADPLDDDRRGGLRAGDPALRRGRARRRRRARRPRAAVVDAARVRRRRRRDRAAAVPARRPRSSTSSTCRTTCATTRSRCSGIARRRDVARAARRRASGTSSRGSSGSARSR